MKNLLLILSTLFIGLSANGQKAEKIYSITKLQKDYTYYSQQAALWEQEVKKSAKDTEAWINYYTAARMNNMFAGEEGNRYDMEAIAEDLKANIPNTFEYYYVSYKQKPNSESAYPHILKAYTVDPDRYETWDAFISKAELEDDTKTMKTFFEKWYQHETYSPGIVSWNYNALIGLDPNAIFITFGDNDTFPLWFLQQTKGIRTDVQVLNASLLTKDDYREKMLKVLGIPPFEKTLEDAGGFQGYRNELMSHVLKHADQPVYIGISAPRSFQKEHHDQLFLTGLTFKYCHHDFDHVAVIRNNFENLFLKDYLMTNLSNDFSQSVVDYMNQQYIPCLTVLYKHYLLSGEQSKAENLEQLLVKIGNQSNRKKEIQDFLVKVKSN